MIALPLLSMLYVRQCDVPVLDAKHGWKFQTKHQLALQMINQVICWLRVLGSRSKTLVVFDGAYATYDLITSLTKLNITVVSRLRSNAKLFDLPPARKAGTRGRPRKYGYNRIDHSSVPSTSKVGRRLAMCVVESQSFVITRPSWQQQLSPRDRFEL